MVIVYSEIYGTDWDKCIIKIKILDSVIVKSEITSESF